MVIFSHILTILIQIGAPVSLAVILLRRFKPGWIILLTGVLTFIGSQMVHLPLLSFINLLPSNLKFLLDPSIYPLNYAILLGLLAGLCEESARWVGFKLLKQRGTSWKAALTLGAGHGGILPVPPGEVLSGFSVQSGRWEHAAVSRIPPHDEVAKGRFVGRQNRPLQASIDSELRRRLVFSDFRNSQTAKGTPRPGGGSRTKVRRTR